MGCNEDREVQLGPKSNHVFLGFSTALLVIHGTSRYHLFPQKLIQAKQEWVSVVPNRHGSIPS